MTNVSATVSTQCLYHPDRAAVTSSHGTPLCGECAGQLDGQRPPRPDKCRRCGRAMVRAAATHAPTGWRDHRGRGLCGACYVHARAHGEIADYDRTARDSAETYDEYQALRAAYCDEDIARRLGLSLRALRWVIRRHRR